MTQHCRVKSANVPARNASRHGGRRRKGAAAVEFAFVAPLLFLLFFGLVEFGRVIMVQQLLTNASREGARRAVVDDLTATDVQKLVAAHLADMSIDSATVSVSPTDLAAANFGDTATVAVKVPFSKVSWLPSPWFMKTGAELTASASMRVEKLQ